MSRLSGFVLLGEPGGRLDLVATAGAIPSISVGIVFVVMSRYVVCGRKYPACLPVALLGLTHSPWVDMPVNV